MARKFQVGIIGLGKFGFCFGESMIQLGQSVVGVDNDPDKIKHSQSLFTQVYQADATDKSVLEQIGFADLEHVLVSVGSSITASAMISMYLKELDVPNIWVKAISGDHQRLLHRIGVNEVIIPEQLAARQLANRLAMPGFIDYLPFDKDVMLKEFTVNRWAGLTLRQIDLTNKYSIQVIATRKGNQKRFRFIPKADEPLEKNDVMVLIGPERQLNRIHA